MLRYIVLALLLFAASILIGGSHPQLPSSAEKFLIEGFLGNKGRVATIEYIRQRRITDFDYLGVQAVFEVRDNFERFYQPLVVLRKRHSDRDWSHSDVFNCGYHHIPELFRMSEIEFLKALVPSRTK